MRYLRKPVGVDTTARMPLRPGRLSRAHAPLPAILFLILLLPPLPSHANEISILAGGTEGIDTGDGSYAWQAAFRYNFLRNFAASLSWINEGHLEEHKRDGFAVQGWGRLSLLDNRLSVGVGAGLYQYFDTKLFPAGDHENIHGWAPIYSLSATYYTERPWFARSRSTTFIPAATSIRTPIWSESGTACGKRPLPHPVPDRWIVRR